MIVDLEKLRKARLAVGIVWTTMDTDSALAEDVQWVSNLLLQIMDDLELGGESIIEKGPIGIYKRGGKDDQGAEAGSDTESSS